MHYVKEEFYHVCLIDEIFFIFKTKAYISMKDAFNCQFESNDNFN